MSSTNRNRRGDAYLSVQGARSKLDLFSVSVCLYIEFDLSYFPIYIESGNVPNELPSLQHIVSRTGKCSCVDDILQHGDNKFYLRKIPFDGLHIPASAFRVKLVPKS